MTRAIIYPHKVDPKIINVKKVWIGWTVNGRWCPTFGSQQRAIERIRKRWGDLPVRTPG